MSKCRTDAASAAGFQFNLGSRVVKGDTTTAFFGHGDQPGTFSTLKNGARVEVKGEQRDGFVFATRIHAEGDDDDGGDDNPGHGKDDGKGTEVELNGPLGAIQGTCPAINSIVTGTRFTTDAATRFDDGCSSLRSGDKVEVKATRHTDGSVIATRVRRK